MRNLARLTIISLVFLGSCKKSNELFDAGGPVTRYLVGRWTLVKVVTPSKTKSDTQIGYNQIMLIGNDGINDYDKIFKDSILIATHKWGPTASGSAATSTVIINYTDGLQRSFKILQNAGETMLQASDYLTKVSSPQDTVIYYYKSSN